MRTNVFIPVYVIAELRFDSALKVQYEPHIYEGSVPAPTPYRFRNCGYGRNPVSTAHTVHTQRLINIA